VVLWKYNNGGDFREHILGAIDLLCMFLLPPHDAFDRIGVFSPGGALHHRHSDPPGPNTCHRNAARARLPPIPTAQRALEAGVLDELQVHLIPVLLGGGRRLFDLLPSRVELEVVRVINTPAATHIRYRVRR
jgi:hypothetical protein